MLNRVNLMGRLVRDPELRQTTGGTLVATFSLAVEQDFKDKSTGERSADFIDIVAWRQTGEFVSRYLSKGRMCVVDGRLQARTWKDKSGNSRKTIEVVADHVYFADSRRDSDASGAGAPAYTPYTPPQPGADYFSEINDDDGELPF